MRIITFLLLVSFVSKPVFSQAPSKKEMQGQMQQVINDLNKQVTDLEKRIIEAKKNKEDAETIKGLEDELASLKKQVATIGGLSRNFGNISDKTFNQASEENNGDIPIRDNDRIKSLPQKVLTDKELIPYVKNINTEVEKNMPKMASSNAIETYNEIIKYYKTPEQLAAIANTCWINGHPETAIYIMGKACMLDMTNGNNLNNYAAFLSMSGGEHAALPILQNLEQRYPDNSTILNNIAQAWFGLGEMNNANKYLDKTMHAYALHPQANRTKAKIQKSEGKKQEAAESLKRSIQENYNSEIETEIEDLGEKLKYEDVPLRCLGKAEPLGIEKFILAIPAYPFEGGEAAQKSSIEWSDFQEKVSTAMLAIEENLKTAEAKANAYQERLLANPSLMLAYNNNVYKTATRKLLLLGEWYTDRIVSLNKEFMEAGVLIEKARTDYNSAMQNLTDCGARMGAATSFLVTVNSIYQQKNSKWLLINKEYFNAKARLCLYTSTDRSQYELAIETIKRHILQIVGGMACEFEVGCIKSKVQEQGQRRSLPDFDEVNCDHKWEIDIWPFTTIKLECNKLTTQFDIDTKLGPKVKLSMEENLSTGKYTKGSAEIGFSKTIDKVDLGPLKAEAKLEVAAGIELDQNGISDVYLKGEVKGKLGTNINSAKTGETTYNPNTGRDELVIEKISESDPRYMKDQSFTATGVEVKVSWNSGASLSGKGLLQNVNISVPAVK